MVLDTSLLNTRQYKVRIKGKVEQSRERSSALPKHLGVVAIEKEPFGLPWLRSPTLLTYSWVGKKFCNILLLTNLQHVDYMMEAVQAVFDSIKIGGVLTCALLLFMCGKQHMLYEFKLNHNAVETTENKLCGKLRHTWSQYSN